MSHWCNFLSVLLLPFTKVLRQKKINYTMIPDIEVRKGHWPQNLQFWLRNGLASPSGRKLIFFIFANHSAVHSVGVSGGRVCGSVAVAVGVCDMWQVTQDTWLVTCDAWNMTSDTWHLTPDAWQYFFIFFSFWFYCIGATMCTRWEILCLLYAGFFTELAL